MVELVIDKLGRQGDGVATENGDEIFVPFSLPGEKVKLSGKGKRRAVIELLQPSPERVEPPCPHFGTCGGCQMQHVSATAYQTWKQELVREPLARAGIKGDIEPVRSFDIASRRRTVFNACRIDGRLHFGFAERASNRIVDIEACIVLDSQLTQPAQHPRPSRQLSAAPQDEDVGAALRISQDEDGGSFPSPHPEVRAERASKGEGKGLDAIRQIAAALPLGKKPVRIAVLAAQNGLDMALEDAPRLSPAQRNALGQKALDLGFLRIAMDGETLIERERPVLAMGSALVCPPAGSFVQAVAAAEKEMATLVCDHLAPCKVVADLFSGIGTFALRLAENSTVLAIEENKPALDALDRAWRETGGRLKQIKTEARNLDRRPLAFNEMKKIDGLVFDPPRQGAEMQAKQIAKSRVKRVAAVSCNPVTLARDLRILLDGGYKITRIVPLDQFRFTPHVEVVALLER